MTKIGAPCGVLEQLDTLVCRLNRQGETGLMIEPLLQYYAEWRR